MLCLPWVSRSFTVSQHFTARSPLELALAVEVLYSFPAGKLKDRHARVPIYEEKVYKHGDMINTFVPRT